MKLGPFLGYMAALICLTWSIWLVIAGIINYDPQSEFPARSFSSLPGSLP